MPYIKKTIFVTQDIIEIEKHHSGRYGKRIKHNPKTNPTPEDVKRNNENNAIKKLRRKIGCNFTPGDLHVVLTYAPSKRPDITGARKALKLFLDRMRYRYRKKGHELKYIITTEYKNKSIHHHVIMNEIGETPQLVRKLWKAGNVFFTVLYSDGQYEDLAAYFVKETKETFKDSGNPHTRYSCSRNLKEPVEIVEKIDAYDWVEVPVPKKGYWIPKDSVIMGINPVTGRGYQNYTMVRITSDMRASPENYIGGRNEISKRKSRNHKKRNEKNKGS